MKKIFTIGTSTRSSHEFFSILNAYDIRRILDIRRFPTSTRYPFFNRDKLNRAASSHGITYIWLGESLGGYRKGGYEKYKSTPEYREGLEKLENLGQEDTSVIVCAELLPWKCHRFQVAEDLVSRGWRVIHIIDRERTWEPSPKQRQQTFVFPKNNGAKTSV